MCKKNINDFTLNICVYLDYDLYSMQIWYTSVHKSTGWTWNITGNSQKSLTAHFFKQCNHLNSNFMQTHHFRLKFYAANIIFTCI